MFKLKKKTRKPDIIQELAGREALLSLADREKGLEFLVAFFNRIRPSRQRGKKDAEENMRRELGMLGHDPLLQKNLQYALMSQLINTGLIPAFTVSGIPVGRNFWQELFSRIKHRMLPPLRDERDFLHVVNRVFFRANDYDWVESIPREAWIRLFEHIDLSISARDPRLLQQLHQSLTILAIQVAQLGLEKEVVGYLPLPRREENPFVAQNYLVQQLERSLVQEAGEEEVVALSTVIRDKLAACYECIAYIQDHHSQRGASLDQTYTLLLLDNRLGRMTILLDALDAGHHIDTGRMVDFFRGLVRNEKRKNSIRELVSQAAGYLAYQIAEHKGEKGGKYITSTWAEYWSMVKSAMSGGMIISFVAIIKNLLSALSMPVFWHGFVYSVNYSAGFVMIEETHSTLATKQPAFTASAVASSFDTKKSLQPNLYSLAVTVAKVSRSQIASFMGNLIIVFPLTYLLAWGWHWATGKRIAEGDHAMQLLRDQHPWQSLSIFYACLTGFFLFLSGIIAGYVENRIRYSRIPERMQMHPILRVSMKPDRLHRLAAYIEKHAGGIVGNVALGFFLGMSSLVGHIFGIPFDVRHITISAGNMAIGAYGYGIANIPPGYFITVLLGVLLIGFFNFLVSFSLAFSVAVRSRGVRLKEYPGFLQILWRYLKNHPLDFIRPRRRPTAE